ncbi:MAG: hemolysin family protein [Fusobacteriota bacterium]
MEVTILIILIILSGIFSASETALTAFKQMDLREIEEGKTKVAKLLRLWLQKPNEILTAILLGNNIVNILASSIATVVAIDLIGGRTPDSSRPVLISTIVMTVVVLIFGEITPKILAKKFSKKISQVVILPIYYLSIITYPIIFLLTFTSRIITRIFGIKMTEENLLITEKDIKSMVLVGEEEGILEKKEKEMIHGIFDFGDSIVKDVMVPRIGMYAIEASKNILEVWEDIIEKGYSRIPVYKERMDNIIGILYLKDLLEVVKRDELDTEVQKLVREPYFVPESKFLIELLQQFKEKKVHIAIALDEYGGTVGMVTIEDLIEEIVGEIEDEYDNNEQDIIQVTDNKYKINPFLGIQEINEELEINIPELEEYDTLGGFIYYRLGRVPEKGDVVNWEGFSITIQKVAKYRIIEVVLEKN